MAMAISEIQHKILMKRITIYILTLIALISCETEAVIDLNSHSQIVVTSFIYKDSTVTVKAYGTVSYTDTTKYSSLNGVYVTMTVNPPSDGISKYVKEGEIATSIDGMNIEYGDSIEIDIYDKINDKHASGYTKMLKPVEIKDISVTEFVRNSTDSIMGITITMRDPKETRDYYQIVARAKEELSTGETRITPLECDYSDYLFYIANSTLTTTIQSSSAGLFNDEMINGKQRNITFNIMKADISKVMREKDSRKTIEVLLYHHTYDYYNYIHTARLAQSYLILPVFGITSIHSNIENGVGIVTGMSFDKKDIEITR